MALQRITDEMIQMFPKWMELRRNENSIGAQTLDTIATQLESLYLIIQAVLDGGLGDIAGSNEEFNILDIDFLYKLKIETSVLNNQTLVVEKLVDENTSLFHPLDRSNSIYDFYMIGSDKFYLDIENEILYFKERYPTLRINGALFDGATIEEHHVWGPLDEIGLLFGCPRIRHERNQEYIKRLNDVFSNPGNATIDGLANYISRSLGIKKEEVVINSLNDDNYVSSMIKENGSIDTDLKESIKIANKINTFGMDSYWEILDEAGSGIKYLPMIWDNGFTGWEDNYIQNGIGDTDDLEIIAPSLESKTQDFTYALYAEGLNYPDKKIYPEHKFNIKLYGEGYKYDTGYSPETFHYTVTASELIPLQFDVTADKLYYHNYQFDYNPIIQVKDMIDGNYYPYSYISTDNIIITNGSYVPNKNKRYLQLAIRLETNDLKTLTPEVISATIKYRKGDKINSIKLTTSDTVSYDEINNEAIIGFNAVDNWDDTEYTGIRFRNDTNDSYRTDTNSNENLVLTKGEYSKTYNSSGDWDDGIKNKESTNVKISTQGNLRLTI